MTRSREKQREQFRQLTVLIAVAFVDMIGFMLVLPVLPFYALNFGATPTQVGWILAAFSIAQLVSAPLWGRVSDRYGRRPALLIGLSAAAVAYVVFGFANSLLLLFLSRLVQGAGGGTTGVAQAYVADTVRPADRARALGWLSSASSAGVIVGPILGTMASHLGTHAPGLIAAGLCVLNAIFAWRWLPESKKELGRDVTKARRSLFAPAIEAFLHPRDRASRLIWIYGSGMLAFAALNGVLPVFLESRYGVNEKTFGYFLTYFGALSLLIRVFLLGPIVDRLGERGTMRLGCVALIAGFVLYPATDNIWVLAIAIMPLIPIGTALLFPSTTSLLSGQVSRADLGVTMGVAQTFAGVARSIGPVASNKAFQSLGPGWPFYLAAAVVGFVSLLSLGVKDQPPLQEGVTGETAIPT
ncbi:MAG TPA: MFS transporter [Gemmatimonadales bacterium]|jgi:MFS family permease|nr:MFS transporter [Gemmatimonadales bacterium]